MSSVETLRLNREDFVGWLAVAFSDGSVWPTQGSAGPERPTDVTLARAQGDSAGWPAVCVPQAQIQDLLAFVFTYTKARPFSAFFHVIPLDLVSVLRPTRTQWANRSMVARCAAGAAMAETWMASARNADRPRNVFPLLLSSLAATLGQVALAGYDEPALDWTVREWIDLRRPSGDIFRQQSVEGATAPWRIILSPPGSATTRRSPDDELVASFMSEALGRGSVRPEMLRRLAPLAGPVDLAALLVSSREERINRFNEVLSDLKGRGEGGVGAEFLAGLMLAIAGNGSFDLLRSAREFDGWLDGAVTWFGICAALFQESNILTYAASAGRRLVRDISRTHEPSAPPCADLASCEFRFLVGNDALAQIATSSSQSYDVEILPNVVNRVTYAAPEPDRRRHNQTGMLLQSLDEASYLIDRARRLTLGSDEDGEPAASTKPPRRGRR